MSYHLIVQPLEPYAVLAGEAESQLFNWVLMDSQVMVMNFVMELLNF